MKKITTFLLSLLAFGSINAQVDEAKKNVNIVAYFGKGDTLQYQMSNVSMIIAGKDTVYNMIATENYQLVVLSESQKGYRIELKTFGFEYAEDNELTEKGRVMKKVLSDINRELYKDKIVFTTNEMGTITGIENFKAYQKRMAKATEMAINNLYKDRPEIGKILPKKNLEQLAKNKCTNEQEAIEELEEISLLLKHHGLQFKLGKKDTIVDGCNVHIETNYDKKDEDSMDGDYFLVTEANQTVPAKDVAAELGDVMELFSINKNDKTAITKLTKDKIDKKDLVVTNENANQYWVNGWPKSVISVTRHELGENYKILEIKQIQWTSIHTH